jgi:hypothetical protein
MFGAATARIRAAVQAFASGFDAADTVDVATAKQLVREWAAIENSAAAIKALAAERVDAAGRLPGTTTADRVRSGYRARRCSRRRWGGGAPVR